MTDGRYSGMAMKELVKHGTLFLAFFVILPVATSGQATTTTQRGSFTITREILKAFYPEIFAKGWYFHVSAFRPVDDAQWGQFYEFHYEITTTQVHDKCCEYLNGQPMKMLPTGQLTIPLSGGSWIGPKDQIVRFFAEGDLACSKKNEQIHELIEAHPEWSEDQALEALRKAGALYLPQDKTKFLQQLHLDRFLEGRLKIIATTFTDLGSEHVGGFSAGALSWDVEAVAELPSGQQIYHFNFEPFEGRLILAFTASHI